MPLLDRLFPQLNRAIAIGELVQRLPLAKAEPDRTRLRCACESGQPIGACDWMSWSLWQDVQTGEIWVFYSGGIADVTLCYGPGERAMAAHLMASKF